MQVVSSMTTTAPEPMEEPDGAQGIVIHIGFQHDLARHDGHR